MVREPAVAGQFYEGNKESLREQIKNCFYAKYGPGDLPVKRTENKIKAVIVPHAGYFFSGACAAWSYKEIAEAQPPEAYILIGPNHFGAGSGLSITDWKTPLGLVKTNKDLVRGIKDNTDLSIAEHNHVAEHSIEVQLPFLQFVNKDFSIVPIVIGRDIDFSRLGKQLFEYLKDKDIVFILSTDFTHYGPSYGYVPFSLDVKDKIAKLDKGAIDLIMNFDTTGFKEYINKTGITICGFMPILVFLAMMEDQKKPKAHLLMHYMSGDIVGDYNNSVSYVSMVFK